MSIIPTIGRVVHYYAGGKSALKAGKQPFAALVCCVQSPTLVNLAVFDDKGKSSDVQNVRLMQEGEAYPESPFCCCMAYQIGQAKKTEEMSGEWIDKIDKRFYEAEKRITGLEEFASRPSEPLMLGDPTVLGGLSKEQSAPDLSGKATGYVDEAEKPS